MTIQRTAPPLATHGTDVLLLRLYTDLVCPNIDLSPELVQWPYLPYCEYPKSPTNPCSLAETHSPKGLDIKHHTTHNTKS